MLRYAITDSAVVGGALPDRRAYLVGLVEQWAESGVDYIQLRERDLDAGALFRLAQELRVILSKSNTKLLIHARADVAVATGASGVHLTSHAAELTPQQVRKIFATADGGLPVVSVSCHTIADIQRARTNGADLILFGPVFEKRVHGEQVGQGTGLDRLREACEAAGPIPVFALGGVTSANAESCTQSGAAGIAGIRLFA